MAAKSEASASSKKAAAPAPAIDAFLRPVGVLELRYVRMLSSLSALTYFMNTLTPESLRRRHDLHLVTSSLACNLTPRSPKASPLQAIVDGDATAAYVPFVVSMNKEEEESSSSSVVENSLAMQVISRVEPITKTKQQQQEQAWGEAGPADLVSSGISAAASAAAVAASVATSAAGSVYSAAAPIAVPFASNITSFTSSAAAPLATVASTLQSAAVAGQSTAAATIATVSAAVMSREGSKSGQSVDCVSPTEWYVADDAASHMRYFVIQGSDNMDHWRVNLTFDPVAFEDPELGVHVHRGVYETAKILYDRFLPLVQEHIASAPSARIVFTGHSLGGSLATLLMMMYLRRGVIGPENLAPVYTFGAPAIFCEGGEACSGDCGSCTASAPANSIEEKTGGVLGWLGLPQGAVRNVIMHRDIVPRAFACDYSLVADLLKRVGGSFRDHKCLNGKRRVMFNFVGRVMVLQPESSLKFVGGDGYHPMLPAKAGLFVLRNPTMPVSLGESLRVAPAKDTSPAEDTISNLPESGATSMAVNAGTTNAPKSASSQRGQGKNAPMGNAPLVASIDEALWELMNLPHPLDILADPGAYGDAGSISRYHNPDNYTRALGAVLQSRGAPCRDLLGKAARNGVKFVPPAPTGPRPKYQTQPLSPAVGGGKLWSPPAVHRSVDRRA